MSSTVGTATEIRPFHMDVPEEDLVELRRRIQATRLPEKEPVADQTQGVQLATIQALMRYCPPAVHHRDRRPRHPLPPREVAP